MIDPALREYLQEMRALTTDGEGREVLVGLSYEESEEYLKHAKRGLDEEGYFEDDEMSTARYLELHDKHELARRQVLLAENEMRNLNPTKN